MTAVAEATGPAVLLGQRQHAASEPPALQDLRARAAATFEGRGVPSVREEAWRFTNVAEVARTPWALATSTPIDPAEIALRRWPGSRVVVVVDGRLRPELSDALPSGIELTTSSAAAAAGDERVLAHLGRLARIGDHPFAALNTALFPEAVALLIAPRAVIGEVIQVLCFSTGGERPQASFPRLLIVAGEASEAKVVEHWIGLGSGRRLICPVEEVVAEAAAVLEHARVQDEAAGTYLLGAQQLEVARGANVASRTFTFGAGLIRNDVGAALIGEGVDCHLDGLYVLRGEQHVDNHMLVDHVAPHCDSHELFKGVLDGRSRAVFNGLLHVHPGAQKTDAKQTNRNLLLSKEALVNTNPQLEIYADDVKCTHGSTVGELDREAMFYLRCRGIGEEAARSLLTWAFAREIVDHVGIAPLVAELEERLIRGLPQGEIVRQVAELAGEPG